jgi:hypothetical protein
LVPIAGRGCNFVTGMVDQELLARNEYLAAENRILKAQLKGRLKLSDAERATLAEIGHRLGRRALGEVANVARPDTILAWYRKLVARKFDGSKARRSPGRPRIKREVEQLIVRMAKENHDWGYDRIVGALANLGYKVCDQTVGKCPAIRRSALLSLPRCRDAPTKELNERKLPGQTGLISRCKSTQVTGRDRLKAFDLPAVQLQIVVLLLPIHHVRNDHRLPRPRLRELAWRLWSPVRRYSPQIHPKERDASGGQDVSRSRR